MGQTNITKTKKDKKPPKKQDKDKDKESITITNVFQKILDERNGKPNNMWIDKGSEFYYRSMISWLQDNDIEMCSTQNERKSAVVERFIRTLKNKIYKYMTPISKIVYIDKYDDIVNKYNNKHHRAIKIKPVDVKFNTSIEFGSENNEKNPKFEIVTMGEYRNIKTFLQKVTLQIVPKNFCG